MKVPSVHQLPAMVSLLEESGLPVDDLSEQDLSLFLIEGTGESVDAMGGLEMCGDSALIRSIVTSGKLRGRGIARAMVDELEKLAASKGLKGLYLLTEKFNSLCWRLCICSKSNAWRFLMEETSLSLLTNS